MQIIKLFLCGVKSTLYICSIIKQLEIMETFKTFKNRELNGGIQYVVRFKNNYGASIVQHSFSYGKDDNLWELAVIIYEKDAKDDFNFELCYSTEITDDVIGFLSEEEVNEIVGKIEKL